MQSETKNCQNCKKDFTIEPDDFSFYEKMKVEIPNFCHDCRLQRKLTWRNERTLYKRDCNLCGKSVISVFSSDKIFPVYCHSCYHGTGWDPLSFGQEINFNTSFLEQFKNLQAKVPRQYALVFNNINSDYTNGVGFSKNCYLVFVSDHNEDCLYSYNIYYCRNSSDLLTCFNCELSYELFNCNNCQRCFFSIDCKDSYDLFFSKDCVNCHDLVGCVGLRNKSYCIFNEQYTKESYKKMVEDIDLNSYMSLEKVKDKFFNILKKYPVKYIHGVNNYNVTGDNVSNSKNTKYVFSGKEIEDSKYIINGNKAKDCYECYVAVDKSELCFDNLGCAETKNVKASHLPWSSYNLEYCDSCENCSDCIGCVSLSHKKYCILNKQYTEEEYLVIKNKIIKHIKDVPYKDKNDRVYLYGEFFPAELSPYNYNETIALFYYPLNKEEAIKQGYSWKEQDQRNYQITLYSKDIPDKIDNVSELIINEIIECKNKGNYSEQCTTAFKVTLSELELYKKLNLPLPHFCHNCRYYQRLNLENPRKLWHRKCMKEGCSNEFETSYAPDRPEIVYCERCYQNEVI